MKIERHQFWLPHTGTWSTLWITTGDPLPPPHPQAQSWPSPESYRVWLARIEWQPQPPPSFLRAWHFRLVDPTKGQR